MNNNNTAPATTATTAPALGIQSMTGTVHLLAVRKGANVPACSTARTTVVIYPVAGVDTDAGEKMCKRCAAKM